MQDDAPLAQLEKQTRQLHEAGRSVAVALHLLHALRADEALAVDGDRLEGLIAHLDLALAAIARLSHQLDRAADQARPTRPEGAEPEE